MMKLLIGGSPCTHWSIAQTKNRETEPSGIGWELFKNYLIALEKYKPDFFLYENNKSMSAAIRAQITRELGVEPIEINSALVSAQSRKRLYWTNIPGVGQPEDKGILLRDILESGIVWREKGYCLKAQYSRGVPDDDTLKRRQNSLVAEPVQIGKPLTDREMEYMVREIRGGRNHFDFDYHHDATKDKSSCVTANTHRGVPYNVLVEPVRIGTIESDAAGENAESRQYRVYSPDASGTIDKPIYRVDGGYITIKGKKYPIKLQDGCYIIRKLTVTECKRLQTVPDDYVFPVSDTQAYKMLGNGWTVDVIVHILGHAPGISTEPLEVLSMYDGMSCGHIALDKLGGHIVKYYATEIDKYAIQTTQHNFPDTIQLGDAFQVRDDGWKIESVEPEEVVTAPAVIKPREEQRPQAVGMSNAVIKYPGAKWGVAPWVISHFPEHRSYLEPFFGSGAVLFTKSSSAIETVSDVDGDIVNLFEWIKNDPERLAHEIYFTPYARAEYDRAWAEQYTEKDSFKRAVNFYIRMMQGHGFRTTGEKVGWKNDVQGREAAYAAKSWCKVPELIMEAAERLRGVQIENRPAVELIRRFNYPNVLIYADPPYLLSTRQRRKQYRHEMTDDDHVELLEALKAHKGPAIISGYDSDLYNTELKGWHKDGRTSFTQTASRRKEILWMNFEPAAQMDMFREGTG